MLIIYSFAETKPVMDAVMFGGYEKVVEQMVQQISLAICSLAQHINSLQQAGVARPSFVSNHLEAMYGEKHDPEDKRVVRLASAMIFIGL